MQHRATYSAEDNKLRIYPGNRLDDELGDEAYKQFKAAGYKWAAKQECFVCPRWTPEAEDWALDLCDEIEDEDYSPEERSADRAERFSGYREKRRDEAHGHADDFESRPAVFGHQSAARAERQARRHDRHRTHALSQWSKAEYWQARTEGVIRHALYRSSAPVRRSRLLRLEAEQRKHVKGLESYRARYEAWKKVAETEDAETARRLAWTLANTSHEWSHYQHPRQPDQKPQSMYCLLEDRYTNGDPISGHEAAALWLENAADPYDETRSWHRWTRHYELRIGYEKAMLAAEGGMAAESDIEPGGWIQPGSRNAWRLRGVGDRWLQVAKVNKSNTTGRVVSVHVEAVSYDADYDRNGKAYGPDNPHPVKLVQINVERLGENHYRPPTDEEREAFTKQQAEKKAARKATTPKAPPLVNPTDDDAERLQAHWNAKAAERFAEWKKRDGGYGEYQPAEVLRLTQEQYSARSKGAYASYETVNVLDDGMIPRRHYGQEIHDRPIAFKVRKAYHGKPWSGTAQRVVVITDKPQKPLPLDWEQLLPPDEEDAEPVACGTQQNLF